MGRQARRTESYAQDGGFRPHWWALQGKIYPLRACSEPTRHTPRALQRTNSLPHHPLTPAALREVFNCRSGSCSPGRTAFRGSVARTAHLTAQRRGHSRLPCPSPTPMLNGPVSSRQATCTGTRSHRPAALVRRAPLKKTKLLDKGTDKSKKHVKKRWETR
jgi:hypothetical protein